MTDVAPANTMDAQPVPPRRLAELPSWLLSRAAGVGAGIVGEALAAQGMRKHHFSVLHSLAEGGSVSQAELGRRLGIDRSDLHAVLGELEASALVVRTPDAHDRRRNTVTITRLGSTRLAELDTVIDDAQDRLLAALDEPERAELRRLLILLLGTSIGGAGS